MSKKFQPKSLKRKRQPAITQLSRRIGRIESSIEQHYFDTPIDTNAGWGGILVTLNPVPQGDTDVTRAGDALTCVKLEIRYAVTRITFGSLFRIIIFKDFQNTVTTPGELLASTLLTNSVLENYNWDNRKQFKILYDRVIRLDGVFSQTEMGQMTLNLKRFRTQFSAGTVTIQTGAVKLVAISNVNPGIGSAPALDLWCRLVFEDL